MKKYVFILIALVLAVGMTLIGCSNIPAKPVNEEQKDSDDLIAEKTNLRQDVYRTLTVDIANDGILTETELGFPLGYFTLDCTDEVSCFFDGATYTGLYEHSGHGYSFSYISNRYKCENGMIFEVRSDNGKLRYISFKEKGYNVNELYLPDAENPEECALAVARETAEKFTSDLDDYIESISVSPYVKSDTRIENDNYVNYSLKTYQITYKKTVLGFESSDLIEIKVNSKGHLVSVALGDVGVFDGGLSLTVDNEKLQNSVEEKVRQLYSAAGYEIRNIEITYQRIGKTIDGDVAVFNHVDVDLIDSGNNEFSTAVVLASILD